MTANYNISDNPTGVERKSQHRFIFHCELYFCRFRFLYLCRFEMDSFLSPNNSFSHFPPSSARTKSRNRARPTRDVVVTVFYVHNVICNNISSSGLKVASVFVRRAERVSRPNAHLGPYGISNFYFIPGGVPPELNGLFVFSKIDFTHALFFLRFTTAFCFCVWDNDRVRGSDVTNTTPPGDFVDFKPYREIHGFPTDKMRCFVEEYVLFRLKIG